MSTENTPTAPAGPAEKSTRWADAEKASLHRFKSLTRLLTWLTPAQIALLVAVNRSLGGKITWANVEVPAGRTTGSSIKQYEAIVKQASGVTMTGGKDITPASKKRKVMAGDDVDGASTPTKIKKPRTPRKKAEPKPKTSPAKSTATTTTSDDGEDFKNEDAFKVKEEECDALIGDNFTAFGDGEEVAA